MRANKKISGFKVPTDYFENLEERLAMRVTTASFPGSTGFAVPENYFESLEGDILGKVAENVKSSTKVRKLVPTRWFGLVAAVAAVLILGVFVFMSDRDTEHLDDIQLGMIDDYIEEGNLNIKLYELTSYFDPETLPEINIEDQPISDSLLEEYLFDNAQLELLATH